MTFSRHLHAKMVKPKIKKFMCLKFMCFSCPLCHSLDQSIFHSEHGSPGVVAGRAMLVVLTILSRSYFLTESMNSGKHFKCILSAQRSSLLAMSSTQQHAARIAKPIVLVVFIVL